MMRNSLIAVGQAMAEGYSWGQAAKQAPAPFRQVDELATATPIPGLAGFQSGLAALLGKDGQGIAILDAADQLLDAHPAFDDLREFVIDLCVIALLGELEEEEDDAFDSPAWTKIEEAAADRGTELLNMLIYLKDCRLNEVEPNLEDFLYEFLLADEEDFQDELSIYEPIIKQAELLDGPLKPLIQTGNNQRSNELRELFTPIMAFFREAEAKPGKVTLTILEASAEPELHCALYRGLCVAHAGEL